MGDATPPPRPGRAPAGSRPTGAGLAAATEPARVAPVGQGQPHPRERCNQRRAATRAENVSAVRARGSDVHRRYEEPDPGRRCPLQAARVTPPPQQSPCHTPLTPCALPSRLLIKKALLDPTKLERAMSLVWDALEGKMPAVPGISDPNYLHSPSPGISRSDPRSWVGASVNHSGSSIGGLRSLGHLDWMLDLVPNDPHVRGIAEAMLGPLRKSRRVR